MAIKNRQGKSQDFVPTKLLGGEFAVVQEGDANTADGSALYLATKAGSVKRIPFASEFEDLKTQVDDVVEDAREAIASAIDPTLKQSGKAADAKKTGDEIADLKSDLGLINGKQGTGYEYGGYYATGLKNNEAYVGVRTNIIKGGALLFTSDNVKVRILLYDDETYLGKVSASYTINKTAGDWYFFVGEINVYDLLSKFNANGFALDISSVDSDTPTSQTAQTWGDNHCVVYTGVPNIVKHLGDFIIDLENENYTEDGYGLLPNSVFQRGLSASGNIGAAIYRIVSKNLVSFDRNVKIKVLNPLYKCYLQFWNNNSYTWESRIVTDSTNVFAGETFRLCIQKVTETTSEYANIDEFRKAIGVTTLRGTERLNELYGASYLPTDIENTLKIRNTEWLWQIGGIHSSGSYRTNDIQKIASAFIPLILGTELEVKTYFPNATYTYKVLFYDSSKTLKKTINWSAYDARFIVEYPYMRVSIGTTETAIDSSVAFTYIDFYIKTGIDDIYSALFELKNMMFANSERISALESDLPSYWLSHLASKISTINSRIGEQYVFITDLHINEGNAGWYGLLIDYILKNTSVTKVICGGDLFTGANDVTSKDALGYLRESTAKVSRNTTADYYYVLGNHDRGIVYGGDDEASTNVITMKQLADVCGMRTTEGVFYDSISDFRYYFDDDEKNIRFIILNPTMGATVPDGYFESINKNNKFLSDSLLSMPLNYNAIIITHIVWNSLQTTYDYSTMLLWNKNICDIIKAFNSKGSATCNSITYDFTSATGNKVVLYHGGHTHLDIAYAYEGINVITTTCDSYALQEPIGSSGRTLGDTSEQAFDVVTVDITNQKLYFDRIGWGNSREFNI